jgi:hypothetical protein
MIVGLQTRKLRTENACSDKEPLIQLHHLFSVLDILGLKKFPTGSLDPTPSIVGIVTVQNFSLPVLLTYVLSQAARFCIGSREPIRYLRAT